MSYCTTCAFIVNSGVRLLVVLLVVVWPVVSDMLIYDGFLDVDVFYIIYESDNIY
jgi:hypothetical protein